MDHEKEISIASDAAAKIVSDAVVTAKELISKATIEAADLARKEAANRDETITSALSKALKEVFDANVDSSRFIDVTRIPLICASIVSTNNQVIDTNKQIDSIKADIRWVVKIVIGAVILGLIALMFKK